MFEVPQDVKLRTVPYLIFGVRLWSVENLDGFVYKYCDTKNDALEYVNPDSIHPSELGKANMLKYVRDNLEKYNV